MISPIDDEHYIGWIETLNGIATFTVSGTLGDLTKPDIATLTLDSELKFLLHDVLSSSLFLERLQTAKTFPSVAGILQKYVNEQLSKGSMYLPIENNLLPNIVLSHLQEVGWEKVISINDDLTSVSCQCIDVAGRQHVYEIAVTGSYPGSPPIIRAALPLPVHVDWSQTYNPSLSLVVCAVEETIAKLQQLFDTLQDIDEKCWVFEPVRPSYAITTRRIALERACSLVLDVDIAEPTKYCEPQFLGPASRTSELRQRFAINRHKWNSALPLRLNLESVLENPLPKKPCGGGEETADLECAVCYTHALPLPGTDITMLASNSCSASSSSDSIGLGSSRAVVESGMHQPPSVLFSLPDQLCTNLKCNRVYHTNCLVQWLQALPSTRTSFGTLFGACPYCTEAISVRISC